MAEVLVRTITDENFEAMGDRMRGHVQRQILKRVNVGMAITWTLNFNQVM
jgi:hypothetical protein